MKQAIIANPIEAVLDEAKHYIGVIEIPPLSNRGTEIDYWLKECKVPFSLPWCAAFTTNILRQALGRGSPVYLNASVQRLVDWANTLKTLNVWQDKPAVGDLFVIYFPSMKRYGHIGFVNKIMDEQTFETIEGNSNSGGSRDGYGVVSNKRKVTDSIKFIRWYNALSDK